MLGAKKAKSQTQTEVYYALLKSRSITRYIHTCCQRNNCCKLAHCLTLPKCNTSISPFMSCTLQCWVALAAADMQTSCSEQFLCHAALWATIKGHKKSGPELLRDTSFLARCLYAACHLLVGQAIARGTWTTRRTCVCVHMLASKSLAMVTQVCDNGVTTVTWSATMVNTSVATVNHITESLHTSCWHAAHAT